MTSEQTQRAAFEKWFAENHEEDADGRFKSGAREGWLAAQAQMAPDEHSPLIWRLLAKLETYHKDGQCRFAVFGFPGFFETGDSAIGAAMLAASTTPPEAP